MRLWLLLLFSASASLAVPLSPQKEPLTPQKEPLNPQKEPLTPQKEVASTLNPHREDENSFHPDCADPHNKEIACSVHKVSCSSVLFPLVARGEEPPEPHDLRIEAFAKSMARQNGKHQLHVDISWQMPPKNTSILLRAFKLEIQNRYGDPTCFSFNVTQFEFNEDAASPRFHFTSESLFDFEENYTVTLYSYPQSSRKPKVVKNTTMPVDPENASDDKNNITHYCKTHSHTEASKWTAGFRRIFLQALSRTIQVEFVGAPPHFCFEEYEVRLLDETGIELLHHTIIKASEMKEEIIDGKRILFGEHNFTGLDVDVDYIPSVIPVEMASDGRCLCPTSEVHGACSCIAADWKKVRLHRIEKPMLPTVTQVPVMVTNRMDPARYAVLYVLAGLFILMFLTCCATGVFLFCCRKYRKSGKAVRIRFIADNIHTGSSASAMVTTSTTSDNRSPLIYNCSTSVLILYSHDCPLHEGTVIAFAELLKETFGFDVHLDVWDQDDIDSNLAEYINASIVRADKIIVINSVGSFHRVRARHMKEDPIERINGGPLDSLFTNQIDLALQHARVISMRFSYSPSGSTLFALTPLLQYTVPDNLSLLIASLNECAWSKNDPRLSGFSPELSRFNAAVSRMSNFVASEPQWFEKFHHRVLSIPDMVPNRSIDSGFETVSQNIATVEDPRITHHSPILLRPSSLHAAPMKHSPISAAVVATSPMVEEDQPLLQLESPEYSYDAPVCEKENLPDHSDSAMYTSSANSEQIPHREVQDKPRLPSAVPAPKDPRYADQNGDSGLVSMDSAMMSSA